MTKNEKLRPPKPPGKKKPCSGRAAKDPRSASARRIASRTAATLKPSAKRRRERFVDKYLVHFVGKKAALEIGIPETSAAKAASEMLREPYVLDLVKKRMGKASEEDLCSRNEVIAGLKREANYEGGGTQHAARVSAWARLAKIKRMELHEGSNALAVHLHFDAQDGEA